MEEMVSVLKEIKTLLAEMNQKLDFIQDDVNVICETVNAIHGTDKTVSMPELAEMTGELCSLVQSLGDNVSLREVDDHLSDILKSI